LISRLVRGDPRRRTRFHDFEGNLIPLRAVVDLVPSLLTAIARKAGRRGWWPWLPYPVVRHLERLLQPSWTVLEFGSGGSTLWLAERVARVVSHEHDPAWYRRVSEKLGAEGRRNVTLKLIESREAYIAPEPAPAPGFDFVLVDGHWRDGCARAAVRLVRPGGLVYFDNSDVPDPDHRSAVATLLGAADESRRFIGFCPGQIAANQGLLVRIRRDP